MDIPGPDEYHRARASADTRRAAEQSARAAEEVRAAQRRAAEAAHLRPGVYDQAVHEVESAMAKDPASGVIKLRLNTDELGLDVARPVLEQIAQEFKDRGYSDAGWGAYRNGEAYIWYRDD